MINSIVILLLFHSTLLNDSATKSIIQPWLEGSDTSLSPSSVWSGGTTKLIYSSTWANLGDYYFTYTKDLQIPGVILEDIQLSMNVVEKLDEEQTKITLIYTLRVDESVPNSSIEIPQIDLAFTPKKNKLHQEALTRNVDFTQESFETLTKKLSLFNNSHVVQLNVTNPSTAFAINIILLIVASLVFASLLVLLTYYITVIRRNKKRAVSDSAIPENLAETIYQKFLEAKVTKTRKGLKQIIPITRNLIGQYITQKLRVGTLEAFYNHAEFDEQIKEGVRKYLNLLENYQYGKKKLTTEDMNTLENDFKTLLFVI